VAERRAILPGPPPAAHTEETRSMPQGTVKSFDPTTKQSVILDDHLNELLVDREAFAASGLRELRLGQRVRFEVVDDGTPRVTNLNIVSL
jgi:cold shock CspA family protein